MIVCVKEYTAYGEQFIQQPLGLSAHWWKFLVATYQQRSFVPQSLNYLRSTATLRIAMTRHEGTDTRQIRLNGRFGEIARFLRYAIFTAASWIVCRTGVGAASKSRMSLSLFLRNNEPRRSHTLHKESRPYNNHQLRRSVYHYERDVVSVTNRQFTVKQCTAYDGQIVQQPEPFCPI